MREFTSFDVVLRTRDWRASVELDESMVPTLVFSNKSGAKGRT